MERTYIFRCPEDFLKWRETFLRELLEAKNKYFTLALIQNRSFPANETKEYSRRFFLYLFRL